MSDRHGTAYLAFRTLEDNAARVIEDIGSEADSIFRHVLIADAWIDEAFPEDNKVIVKLYLEMDIDKETLQNDLVANLDYAFASSETGDEYRMELFDSALQYADI